MLAIALTGAPGAGKTAVIDALRARGYNCVAESARAIIRDRLDQGLSPRPSPQAFAEQIFERDKEQYRRISQAAGPVFFDRSYIDSLGMLSTLGLLSERQRTAILAEFPLQRTAFIFPPWEAIYTTDTERDQTFSDSVVVHDAVAHWYRRCGLELIEVPRQPVDFRCEFILRQIR
jgi:predicted ATPase